MLRLVCQVGGATVVARRGRGERRARRRRGEADADASSNILASALVAATWQSLILLCQRVQDSCPSLLCFPQASPTPFPLSDQAAQKSAHSSQAKNWNSKLRTLLALHIYSRHICLLSSVFSLCVFLLRQLSIWLGAAQEHGGVARPRVVILIVTLLMLWPWWQRQFPPPLPFSLSRSLSLIFLALSSHLSHFKHFVRLVFFS